VTKPEPKPEKENPASAAKHAKMKIDATPRPVSVVASASRAFLVDKVHARTDPEEEENNAKEKKEGESKPGVDMAWQERSSCQECKYCLCTRCVWYDKQEDYEGIAECITNDLEQGLFQDLGLKSMPPKDRWNRTIRYHIYRAYVFNTHPGIKKGQRIRIPMCVVSIIREKWPNAEGEPYVGHKDGYTLTM